MARNSRKSQHKALLKEIAALINQPADSLAVRLVALARLKLDGLEAQLLDGDPAVTVADITTLQETFDKYVQPKIELRVKFVDGSDTAPVDHGAVSGVAECRRCGWTPSGADRWPECPRCGWRHGADTAAPWTPLIALPATSPAASENNAPAGSPATNVVPLDDEQRAELAQQRRQQARVSNGIDPGPPRPPAPRATSPLFDVGGDNRSISEFQRTVDAAYRGHL